MLLLLAIACGRAPEQAPPERVGAEPIAEDSGSPSPTDTATEDTARPAHGYPDADGDGHGRPWFDLAENFVTSFSPTADDCDDRQASVHPGAAEICDGLDNDCDGEFDEAPAPHLTWYRDEDGDGYGDPSAPTSACYRPYAHALDASDCDDTDATVHPLATGWCNGRDDDCDGLIDGEDPDETTYATWYADADGDGFGGTQTVVSCAAPAGHTLRGGDCADHAATVHPGAREWCADGLDTDCDGVSTCQPADADARIRDVVAQSGWVGDVDGDGHRDLVIGGSGSAAWPFPAPTHGYVFRGPLEHDASVQDAWAVLRSGQVDYNSNTWAPAGDMDGDGYDDLWFGARRGERDGEPSGAVWLIPGGRGGERRLDEALATWRGRDWWDEAGSALSTADPDGDGTVELIVGARHAREIYVAAGPHLGTRELSDARATLEARDDRAIAADFDGDGAEELAVHGTRGSERIVAVHADPRGALTAADAFAVLSSEADWMGRPFEAGDLDGDGLADLWVYDGGLYVWLVTGADLRDGGEHLIESSATAVFGAQAGSAGDIDGDGHLDAVVTPRSDFGDEPYLLLAPGPGTWFEPDGVALPDVSGFLVFEDVDGDGRSDLLTSGDGSVVLLPGAGLVP